MDSGLQESMLKYYNEFAPEYDESYTLARWPISISDLSAYKSEITALSMLVEQTLQCSEVFLYRNPGARLGHPGNPRVKRTKTLPEILSREEIERMLSVTKNIKHKAMLMVTYSTGLRVSETAALKSHEIDAPRMV